MPSERTGSENPSAEQVEVRSRLNAYHQQTKPLSDWYSKLSEKTSLRLISVDGRGSIDEVAESINSELEVF